MPRQVKKALAWGFWGANLTLILGVWAASSGRTELFTGDGLVTVHTLGLLFGLLATFCALTQFILMGRVGWLEPIFGLDRLAIFHRFNGYATLILVLLHSSIMFVAHGVWDNELFAVLGYPFVVLAVLAEVMLVLTVGLSIYIIRRHLKFETWYTVHWLNYLFIAIVPFHQFVNGTTLNSVPWFSSYWLALYIFVALNVIVWRFGMTVVKHWRFGFKVEKVVAETPTATSVYITGKNLEKYKARGGQFVLVRFLAPPYIWQEHPFSLSMLPNKEHIRLTIRQLGDFTNLIPQLKPGTPVWVSGPFGTFTNELQETDKVLYIAGGIGITPIRSMIEARARSGVKSDAVMLYGNRTETDTALMNELQPLAAQLNMPIHNVLSEQKDYAGEKGYVDKEKIARLVPDVAERDVFLCGPPPMMAGVIAELKELGVPDGHIHFERFSLHSK
jgi:predicted ferric reductase